MTYKDDFQRTVAPLLEARLYERRGLTREEYIERCRKVWEEREATDDYPYKILIDRLHSPGVALAPNSYRTFRAGELIQTANSGHGDLYCVALGLMGIDGNMDRPGREKTRTLLAESASVPENRTVLLALFDVLGFESMLNKVGLSRLHQIYKCLLETAIMKDSMDCFGLIRVDESSYCSAWYALPVEYAYFSDTILLWIPLMQHYINPFVARCADLVCEGLKSGVPLRGSISLGKAVLHRATGTYLGEPLVEAARGESAQNWIGVSFGLSTFAEGFQRELEPNQAFRYPPPAKPQGRIWLSGEVVDWPRRCVEVHAADPIELVQSLDTDPKFSEYYQNTLKFVRASQERRVFKYGLPPLTAPEIARAVLKARELGQPIPELTGVALRRMRAAGPPYSQAADFFEAVGMGSTTLEVPADLPPGIRSFLKEVAAICEGKHVALDPRSLGIAALAARFGIRELSPGEIEDLATLVRHGPPYGVVGAFIQELAVAGSTPEVSISTPDELQDRLQELLQLVSGRLVDGLLSDAAQAAIRARFLETPLFPEEQLLLKVIGASSTKNQEIAEYLFRASNGADTEVLPTDVAHELLPTLFRFRAGARKINVPTVRMHELFFFSTDDGLAGVNLWVLACAISKALGEGLDLPEEVSRALDLMRSQGNVDAWIADHMVAAWTRSPDREPSPKLPTAAQLFLCQFDAFIDGKPIPLDPWMLALAAVRARHGNAKIGDYLGFSLQAMFNVGGPYQTVATYLARVARGETASPLPDDLTGELDQVAEWVRNMADSDIGQFRLLWAKKETTGRKHRKHTKAKGHGRRAR